MIRCFLGLHTFEVLHTRPLDPDDPTSRLVTVVQCRRCHVKKGFIS